MYEPLVVVEGGCRAKSRKKKQVELTEWKKEVPQPQRKKNKCPIVEEKKFKISARQQPPPTG